MAITYPLNHPASPGFVSFELKRIPNVGLATSLFTFKQEAQKHQGQVWSLTATLPQMNRADAAEWNAFVTQLNGVQGTFLMGDPDAQTPRGVGTGTPVVDGASQVGNSLATKNWTVGITNILRKWDYLQLGSGLTTFLHVVLNDADSDGVGEANFDIWPDLRVPPADLDSIIVNSTKGLFRMATNEMSDIINAAKHHSVEFSAIEAL